MQENLILSENSKIILAKIESLLRTYSGFTAYLGNGVIKKNFQEYDLKSKAGRD